MGEDAGEAIALMERLKVFPARLPQQATLVQVDGKFAIDAAPWKHDALKRHVRRAHDQRLDPAAAPSGRTAATAWATAMRIASISLASPTGVPGRAVEDHHPDGVRADINHADTLKRAADTMIVVPNERLVFTDAYTDFGDEQQIVCE